MAWQANNVPEAYDPVAIAHDLVECRARGLDWLDHRQTNQQPVRATELQRLAEDYAKAQAPFAVGRISQIKILLEHGIAELERQRQPTDANLLKDLFFGDGSPGTAGMRPGDLLERARRKVGESETRFRERRRNVMNRFAGVLVTFTINAGHQEEVRSPLALPEEPGGGTSLLAAASKATIIGITNERLQPLLEEALRRKRADGRPDAFWDSLRIVFLADGLLGAINDEREILDDRDRAWRQRRREAYWARRFIGVYLKRTHPSRWELFESNYLPELTGALLESGDRKVAHLMMRRPRRPPADHLYVDLEDRTGHLGEVFEDIVRNSASHNMIVPVGVPSGATFQCSSFARPQADVLKDFSGDTGWLPMILIVTYRRREGQIEAVLQVRTTENAAREENRLSHIGGHILQADRLRAVSDGQAALPRTLDLTGATAVKAAERLAENVTGIDSVGALRPVTTGRYLYPDKEKLFFFVYSQELPEGDPLPGRSGMRSFSLPDLMAIRADQVLALAAELCRTPAVPDGAWAMAAEVLALNLTLHGRRDLAGDLRDLAGRAHGERATAADLFAGMVGAHAAPRWAAAMPVSGLAGWQYREFFSVLLPLYADVGVRGATEVNDLIAGDDEMRSARDELARIYQDEYLIMNMPIEL